MNRSLGSGSSIPREGTPQTPTMEAARGGEPEPSDRRYRAIARNGVLLLETASGDWHPSNVQLALAHAHVAWAKRDAPHLLEEWLDD